MKLFDETVVVPLFVRAYKRKREGEIDMISHGFNIYQQSASALSKRIAGAAAEAYKNLKNRSSSNG